MRNLGIFVLGLTIAGCKSDGTQAVPTVAIEDIDRAPVVTSADTVHKNVFAPLDGTWRGKFDIYTREGGQAEGPVRPTEFDPAAWKQPPYRLEQTIRVRQTYVSESPYFQRVTITDTLPDGNVIESRGVNKVQNGRLYCVVKKPDDLVLHDGKTDGPGVLIWSRARTSPPAVEYFRETVHDDTYTIVGWGYYPGDDLSKAPHFFFDATYNRVTP